MPFEKWGINYIGTIHLSSSRGMQYIIVVTEYLIKWAEAKAIKFANAKQIVIFFYENIISQFGCLNILINDGGFHLLNDAIVDSTKLFNINHRKTTQYHPQTNGLTKRMNQTLIHILHKIVTDSKQDWDHKLVLNKIFLGEK
jgi:hypothetical protein